MADKGESLVTQTQSIIEVWLKRIREEVPAAFDRDDSFLIDHIPSFVELVSQLDHRPSDQNLFLQCIENAKLHGQQRASDAAYTVDQISLEFTLLRECMISSIGTAPGVSIADQMKIFFAVLDSAIAASAAEFVRYQSVQVTASVKKEDLNKRISDQGRDQMADQNLAHFFAQAPFPLALFSGPEHLFILSNQAYSDLIGKNPVNKTVREVFTHHEAGEFFALLDSVYHTGIPYEGHALPFNRQNADGSSEALYINIAYHPYRDAKGEITGIFAFVNDVTDQIMAHQKIEESEARIRSVFAHASVGFVITNLKDEVIEANPRFSEITGYSVKELRSQKIHELVHPDDRPRENIKLDELVAGKISNFIIEKRFIKKDKSLVWVRNSVSLVPGSNDDKLIIRVAEDVTAFKEAERLRLETEDRYVKLADSMPQIVWTANPSGELDYFNQVWFDYSGTTYEENAGNGWVKAVHAEDLPRTVERWTHSLKTNEVYENEFRLRSSDGSYRWHVARALPTFDDQGKVKAWFGTNTDIHNTRSVTDQLASAKRAVEMEQTKFETIFADSAVSMAVLKGPDHVYEIANPSYLALFNGREILGKPFLVALPELADQPFPQIAKKVFETGIPYRDPSAIAFLKRTDTSDVEERYFDQAYTRMLDADGKPYGVFIHAIEVTEQVFAQRALEETTERFKNAVNAADMGTWELNPQTGMIIWSDRTRELFGISKVGSIPLTAATERIHPEDRARVEKAITEAIDPNGTGKYELEYRINHDHGETRWVSVMGQSFFTDGPEGRKTTKFGGTVLDVTDRIMSEVALRDAKERAEAANAAKSTFLANMSHEIRTPLGAIMGFVSLIKDEHVSQSVLSNYVSVIERNSTQLLRIIDDILDLSKVEAGMMQIEHIEFSLVELLSDFSSFIGFRAREKGIAFILQATTTLPNVVISDPTRLRQILTNVVGNAIKFTEHGAVKLSISYIDQKIYFEVEDTGKGISEDQVSRLFQPFSQGDISTTRKFGGTGLGLVLTRKLSEALGGGFGLKSSSPNTGSVFEASIHVDLSERTKFVKALGFAPEAIRNAGVPVQLKNMRILLVEDSLDNQELFSIFLSKAGAKIDIASDGLSGYEMAMADDYDVVLMDVQMPIMDGITAVKKLRAAGYKAPIVALTAHAMKEERLRCLDAGYTAFLSKPVQRNELIELLTRF